MVQILVQYYHQMDLKLPIWVSMIAKVASILAWFDKYKAIE